MKPREMWMRGRALAAVLMAATLTVLPAGDGLSTPVANAHSVPGLVAPLCAPAATSPNEHVNLSAALAADPDPNTVVGPTPPTLGWWTTDIRTVNTRRCINYAFELEPGTEAQAWLRLVPAGAVTTDEDLASAVASCSWTACLNAGTTRLHESTDANVWRSLPKVGHAATEGARRIVNFEVLGMGRATVQVVLAYGALEAAWQNVQGASPETVPADAAKMAVTGQSDHTMYADQSSLGQDSCLAVAQQFDADQPGDAGNSAGAARIIPLGTYPLLGGPVTPSNRIRIGQRGLFINGRVGDGDRVGADCAPAGGPADNHDWYSLTVQPGAQVVVNLWPTRYDYYGGGLQYRLIRLIPTGGTATVGAPQLPAGEVPATVPVPPVLAGPAYSGAELLCNGETAAPNEPVFNPALQCGRLVGYVPHVNSGVTVAVPLAPPATGSAPVSFANPDAVPTTFLLHVSGQGFVRYSMTVDHLGDGLPATPGCNYNASQRPNLSGWGPGPLWPVPANGCQ